MWSGAQVCAIPKLDIGYQLVLWNLWLALRVKTKCHVLIPLLVGFV